MDTFKILSDRFIENVYTYRFKVLFVLSFVLFIPLILPIFYVQPFADDLALAGMMEDQGRLGFIIDYFQNWSGRYAAMTLLSIPASNPEGDAILYKIMPFLFLFFLWISVHFLLKELTNGRLNKKRNAVLAFFSVTVYLAFIPEIFSALYWNCAIYYLVFLAFYLLFLKSVIRMYQTERTSLNLLLMSLFCIFICGLHELLIIYNLLLFGFIFVWHFIFSKVRKIDYFSLIMILVSLASFAFVMKFSGNGTRIEVSGSQYGIFYVLIRSSYELLLLNFYKLISSPVLIILLAGALLAVKTKDFAGNSLKLFYNIHPIVILLVLSVCLFASHALSLYAAGYTLQGRVMNINFFLLYGGMFLFFSSLFSRMEIQLSSMHSKFLTFSMMLALMFGIFTKPTITAISESRHVLPTFNKEMNARFDVIREAKSKGLKVVKVDPISVNPRTFTLGEFRKNVNFYNSVICLYQTSLYFKIKVKLKVKPDDFDFN